MCVCVCVCVCVWGGMVLISSNWKAISVKKARLPFRTGHKSIFKDHFGIKIQTFTDRNENSGNSAASPELELMCKRPEHQLVWKP